MTETIKVRSDDVKFDLTFPDQVNSVYADGVSNAAVGYPISKLLFHTIEAPRQNGVTAGEVVERRRVVLEMSIPTAALVELCANVVAGAAQSRDALKGAANDMTAAFAKILDKLETRD